MVRKPVYPELAFDSDIPFRRKKKKELPEITDPEAILRGAKPTLYVIRLKNHRGELLDHYLQAPRGWVPSKMATTYPSRESAEKALKKMPWIPKSVEIELQ